MELKEKEQFFQQLAKAPSFERYFLVSEQCLRYRSSKEDKEVITFLLVKSIPLFSHTLQYQSLRNNEDPGCLFAAGAALGRRALSG
ncbi:hypothetical protein NQZ68_039614 [Dissostichus eleginoides]|nr:hypothetical protein NQZ68_039614 [Dissostichus eleginoides]